MPIEILADHRERASGVVPILASNPEVTVRYRVLDVGDYCVGGRVLVERKTMDDLVDSVVSARVFRQAARLARSPFPGVLVVEGRPCHRRTFGRRQLQGALITLALVFKLTVLRSGHPGETAWLLHAIGRQSGLQKGRGFTSRLANPRDADAHRLRMLTCLPGVGPRRAEALLARFASIHRVATATSEELATTRGIGPPTAEAIRDFFTSTRSDDPGHRSSGVPSGI